MRRIIAVGIILILLVGCTGGRKVGYFDMLDMLKMKPGDVETKEESEDDIRIIYDEFEIMMYDSYSRVICRQWKTDLVMYEKGKVLLTYEDLKEIRAIRSEALKATWDIIRAEMKKQDLVWLPSDGRANAVLDSGKVVKVEVECTVLFSTGKMIVTGVYDVESKEIDEIETDFIENK